MHKIGLLHTFFKKQKCALTHERLYIELLKLEPYSIIIDSMFGKTNPTLCILIRTDSFAKYEEAIELNINANNHLSNEETTLFSLLNGRKDNTSSQNISEVNVPP